MERLFGIETEYGITREDLDKMDPVIESMELVRSHRRPFRSDWDYGGEDPKQDVRGFRAKSLQQEKEEQEFSRQDRHRPFSFHEMKSDLMLGNGARFYNDHTHPEYSTPECTTLKALIAHDRAGERILRDCALRREHLLKKEGVVQLYKNNTDFHGHSYGCHDNYLFPREVPFADLANHLMPFLITRQIFSGSGKVGVEIGSAHQRGVYQLSQRADFIEVEVSIDTMDRRPIINTRDEPHADAQRYRRLHLIIGDANMSEWATALKVGTTWLVLRLIAEGKVPKEVCIDQPVETLHRVSRDTSLRQPFRLIGGRSINPIDHQRLYLQAAQRAFPELDDEMRWVVQEWEATLDDLEKDPMLLSDRLDWVAKKWLLETFMDAEGTGWSDPRLASLDLEYHNIDPKRGLYLEMEAEGRIRRLVSDEAISEAMSVPPLDTRAGVRGLIIQRFLEDIYKIQWEKITFQSAAGGGELKLDLLFEPERAAQEACRIAGCRSIQDILKA